MIRNLFLLVFFGWILWAAPHLRIPLIYFLLVAILFFVAYGIWNKVVLLPRLRREGILPEEGKATLEDVHRLVKAGKTTLAIGVYRSLTATTLKEAKRAVSTMSSEHKKLES